MRWHALHDGMYETIGWAFTWPLQKATAIAEANKQLNGRVVRFDPSRPELSGRKTVRHYGELSTFVDEPINH